MRDENGWVDEAGARDALDRLEAELDALKLVLERCRKSTLVARVLVGAGAILFAIAILRSDGTALVTGIAAALGGIVLGGSTRTTRALLAGRMKALESERADLIDGFVAAEPTLHLDNSSIS